MEIRLESGKDKPETSAESEEASNRLEPEHILDQTMLGRKIKLPEDFSCTLSTATKSSIKSMRKDSTVTGIRRGAK